MALSLTMARLMVRQWLRANGFDTTLYSDSSIDQALSLCGDQLARETTCLYRVDTLTLYEGGNAIQTPAWDSATTYLPGAQVVVSTTVYVCILANTNHTPPNATYWTALSVTGATAQTLPTNFRPDRLISAYLSGDNVIVTPGLPAGYSPYFSVGAPQIPIFQAQSATLNLKPFETLLNQTLALQDPAGVLFQAQPRDLAFQKRDNTGIVFPMPDDNYTLNILWNDLFGTWTQGTQGAYSSSTAYNIGDVVSSGGHTYYALVANTNVAVGTASTWTDLGVNTLTAPASVTFNLVDDYLRPLIVFGTPAHLQYSEPSNAYAAVALGKWKEFIESMKSVGDLGENYVERAPAYRGGDGFSGGYGPSMGFY